MHSAGTPCWFLIQQVWGGTCEHAFLTRSQVMWMLLSGHHTCRFLEHQSRAGPTKEGALTKDRGLGLLSRAAPSRDARMLAGPCADV